VAAKIQFQTLAARKCGPELSCQKIFGRAAADEKDHALHSPRSRAVSGIASRRNTRAIPDGAYLRFTGNVQLEHFVNGELVKDVSDPGSIAEGVVLSMDIEQLIYDADRLQGAALLLNQLSGE
jgi:hypothetical protein